jgi:hypothetical protein
LLTLAILSASLIAVPVLAQDGGVDPGANTPYAGTSKQDFYDVDQRMNAIEQQIKARGHSGARAMAAMRSIRSFEATQRARHGGQLRDWDREAINVRLDQLVGRYRLG